MRAKLGVLAAALAAVVIVACAVGTTPPPGPECKSTETVCSGVCVDLQGDSLNCGKCGAECGTGLVCVKGACATSCPPGNSACGGDAGTGAKCVNTKTDNTNCGGCGKVCKSGEVCAGSQCVGSCGTQTVGQTSCVSDAGASYCANLKNDNQNCGACGKACPSDQVCALGVCQGSCTVDQTKCGGDGGPAYCANTKTDNANCGACGKTCGVLEACVDGTCSSFCTSFQKLCVPDGGAPSCIDYLTDNKNCGTCGNVCPVNKPMCSGGACNDGTCNKTALLLGDGVAASNTAYQNLLTAAGFSVTLQASGTTTYTGSPAASTFGVVIVTPGNTYATDMPLLGQQSIIAGQAANAGIVFTEFFAYHITNSRYLTLQPLLLFPRTTGYASVMTFNVTQVNHPIWAGLPSTFSTASMLSSSGALIGAAQQIASYTQSGNNPGVAIRDNGGGRIVQIAHSAGYNNQPWYNDANLVKMMSNSALWAARCN